MPNSATRALPFTNAQRQLVNGAMALIAVLGTREPTVNLDQRSPIPVALVLKLPDQLPPTRITDSLSKAVVL
ncbi:MAG: hypothetical protein WBA76_19770, partial [Phormidesmis sp.]